jgi:hypothetical protein
MIENQTVHPSEAYATILILGLWRSWWNHVLLVLQQILILCPSLNFSVNKECPIAVKNRGKKAKMRSTISNAKIGVTREVLVIL